MSGIGRRGWLACCLLAFLLPSAWAIDPEPLIDDPARQELYERLTHEVRCLVCQNQTVADSTAPLAADLRRELHALVVAGRSEDEIKTFLLDRYGDFVLYKPRFQGTTAILWLAPLLLLLGGALVMALVVRRRATLPSDEDADENTSTAAGS